MQFVYPPVPYPALCRGTPPLPISCKPFLTLFSKNYPLQVAEAQQLFEAFGAVMDVKLFPCLDQFRGASALVRMASIEAADRSITALNNSTPPGGMQSLIVRFAESASEKAARLSRRERAQLLQRNGNGLPDPQALGGLDQMQLQQAMAALGLGGAGMPGAPQALPNAAAAAAAGLMRQMPPSGLGPIPPMAPAQPFQQAVQSSICVKGMPPNADRLWLYENFARFGAIQGMRILIDEQTGLCNGTAFINYGDPLAAQRSRQAMSGMRAGEKILHVIVQQQPQGLGPRPGGTNGGNLAAAVAAAGVMAMPTMPNAPDQGDWQQLLQPALPPGNAMVW